MTRARFQALAAVVPLVVGALAAAAPSVLLDAKGVAAPDPAAAVMARTAGVLLVAVGGLNLQVARQPDGPTVRAVLAFDLLVQLLLLPIDPHAYATGAFTGLGSFVPNTVLHVVLAAGFLWTLLTPAPQISSPSAPRSS